MRHSSSLLAQSALFLLPLLQLASGDAVGDYVASIDQPSSDGSTVFLPVSSGNRKRGAPPSGLTALQQKLFDLGVAPEFLTIDFTNESSIPKSLLYQFSPYYKPAAVLKSGTGSVVTTLDIFNSNFGTVRGQSVISQRNTTGGACPVSDPIKLFSGFGDRATVLKEDIFFDGGVIHITDRYVSGSTRIR